MGRMGLLALAATTIIAPPASAQTLLGDWGGTLDVDGRTMRIVVHIERDEQGALTGNADSPDQEAFGIPLGEIEQDGSRMSFTVPSVRGAFSGRWTGGAWVGQWSQGGGSLPLTLRQGAPTPPENAPPVLPADWSIPADAAIGELLESRISDRPGVGMVVGVLDDREDRVIARGPDGPTDFDARTVFEIGSLTKLFTGLLLADMTLRGEVSPDDPARLYLPDGATMPTRDGREITLRDLSMHISGLPRLPDNMPYGDSADPYADYSEQDLLAFLRGYELPRDIGSSFEYSNLGVGLLGYLLQRAAGQDFKALVRERITSPLGMDDTVYALSPEQRQRLAPGLDAYLQPAPPWNFGILTGAGGIYSTASDMLVFAGAVADSQSPIAAAVDRTLSDRGQINRSTEVGLGWLVAKAGDAELVFHGGGTGGHRAAIAIDREAGHASVVLTNTALEPAADDMAFHLLTGRPLAETMPPRDPPSRTAIDLAPEQLDRVTGTYAFSADMVLQIRRNGNGLEAQLTGQPFFPIFAASPLEFFWRVVDARVRILTDNAGEVTGALLMQNGSELAARRTGPAE